MFEWLHHQQESLDLEHAKQRQNERDLVQNQRDPLAEYEVINSDGLVVEELSSEEFKDLIRNLKRPDKRQA